MLHRLRRKLPLPHVDPRVAIALLVTWGLSLVVVEYGVRIQAIMPVPLVSEFEDCDLRRQPPDDVVLVVSQPDRPKGRGKKLVATPVKALAEMQGLPVRQPRKLKDGVLAAELRALDVDLAIVVAYGRLMPTDLFEAPRLDTWNVHASLLPRHRGDSPIQHAILAGDDQTGVSLMHLCE